MRKLSFLIILLIFFSFLGCSFNTSKNSFDLSSTQTNSQTMASITKGPTSEGLTNWTVPITTEGQITQTTTQITSENPISITTKESTEEISTEITTEIKENENTFAIRLISTGVEIIGYYGTDSIVVIPETIDDLVVTRVGNYAFSKNSIVEEITIPDSVTEIGDYAFINSINLKRINLSSSVISIGENITENCHSLKEINISDSNPIFYSRNGVVFKKGINETEQMSYKTALRKLSDSENEDEIFLYPEGKTDDVYYIPEGVTNIGQWAFKGNQYIKEIIIPDSVNVIGVGAFMHCSSLETLLIPGSISVIPTYMCYGCSSLTNLTLSEGITKISTSAFERATSLSNLAFPISLLIISTKAFASIGPIQEVYLHPELAISDGSVFALNENFVQYNVDEENINYQEVDGVLYSKDLSKIISYPSGKPSEVYKVLPETIEIGIGAFEGNNYLKEITYAGNIEKIGTYAFSYMSSIEKITIPKDVSYLTFYTVYKSTAIKEFDVSPDNPNLIDVDGILFTKDMSTLLFYPSGKIATEYSIPIETKTVNDLAFFENQYLEQITITENVEIIKGGAFAAMYSLNIINVEEGNPYFNSIEGVLFSEDFTILYTVPSALSLETYQIPETVTTLYYGAFEGNKNLKYIIIPNTVTTILSYTFQQCVNLEWIVIPTSVEQIMKNIVFESYNTIIYFEGIESDYSYYPNWNLDNIPYYYSEEWEYNEDQVPELITISD